jgi:hypothetical protein
MQGWSLFKLARLEDALKPFFGVLDLPSWAAWTHGRPRPARPGRVPALSRADRELVEDSFRVLSLQPGQPARRRERAPR